MSDSGQDHLSNEIGLEASLSESGVSGKVRSRAASALDRLLGSLFDIPAAKWEAVAQRIRARSDQEVRLIASETTTVVNAIEGDEDLGRKITEYHLSSGIRCISNKHKVAKLAIEHLSKEGINEEQDSEDDSLEEDWLNYFEQYAEKASSERMQDLWGRVLAGEIRKPRSFSLVTLRFLAELEKEIAKLYENTVTHRLSDGFILHPPKQQMRGRTLLDLTFLEEVGLLQNVSPALNQTLTPDDGVIHWMEGDFLLRAGTNEKINFDVIRITRIGREISSILPPTDKVSVLEKIEEKLGNKLEWSEISMITGIRGDTLFSRPIKIIKPKKT